MRCSTSRTWSSRARHWLRRKPGRIRESFPRDRGPCRNIASPDPEIEMRVCPYASEIPLRSAASSNGGSGKLLVNLFVNARAAKFAGHAYGVLDGVGIRAAVGDDGDSAHTQQRSAAGFRRVGTLAEIVKGLFGQSVADLRFKRAFDGLLQHALNVLHQPFTDFQRDVPDKAIANDHVHISAKHVAAFHIAYKIQ